MKKHLFYTFLLIFIMTACVTLLGVINVLKIKESYLDVLFGTLVIEIVASVIALFKSTNFFEDPQIESNYLSETNSVDKCNKSIKSESLGSDVPINNDAKPEKCELSFIQYKEKKEHLRGRFHELEEFSKDITGKIATWNGRVTSVTSNEYVISIQLSGDDDFDMPGFMVNLPLSMKTKAFALRKDDIINATGAINTDSTIVPVLENGNFELQENEPKINDEDISSLNEQLNKKGVALNSSNYKYRDSIIALCSTNSDTEIDEIVEQHGLNAENLKQEKVKLISEIGRLKGEGVLTTKSMLYPTAVRLTKA